jgi:hypothetical protein
MAKYSTIVNLKSSKPSCAGQEMGAAVENDTPQPQDSSKTESGTLVRAINDAARFWEPRRLIYNSVLVMATLSWLLATWPHFRPALRMSSLVLLAILAAMANLCYCAAYLLDIPMQLSSIGALWRRRRWVLWLVGTAFAVALANYWIADEIYPFVR